MLEGSQTACRGHPMALWSLAILALALHISTLEAAMSKLWTGRSDSFLRTSGIEPNARAGSRELAAGDERKVFQKPEAVGPASRWSEVPAHKSDGSRCIRVVGGETASCPCFLHRRQAGWRPPGVDESSYVFRSDRLPDERRHYATVGNGHLATAAYGDKLFLNGVYNGRGSRSRRAAVPSWGRLNVSSAVVELLGPGRRAPQPPPPPPPAGLTRSTYSLNAVEGVFAHQIVADDFEVMHRLYAHRVLQCLLVNDVTMTRTSGGSKESAITVKLDAGTKFVSSDIVFFSERLMSNVTLMRGRTRIPESSFSFVMPVYAYFDEVPPALVLPAGIQESSWTFLTSVGTNENDVIQQYYLGVQQLQRYTDGLYAAHAEAWASTWQRGRVDVWGGEAVHRTRRAIYSSLYYILSSLPLPGSEATTSDRLPFFGLSPESLAYGDGTLDDYQGHVFWDQETWMFPPLLILQSNFTPQIMASRTRILAQAMANARASNDLGARFPWEQAFTGIPTSPSNTCEKYEIHINGDIALAIRQYVVATMDTEYLTNGGGLKLAEELAKFWEGRLSYRAADDSYHILDVQPPDEYHFPVNDSVYTNSVAKLALQLPALLLDILNNQHWDRLASASRANSRAERIYIPFDPVARYHPEFEGYSPNKSDPTVKQADATMLGFPLMQKMPADVHLNDLNVYSLVTDPSGPAMTWSVFAINYLQAHAEVAAQDAFARQFSYITQPFQVWTENSDGSGAVNFITGMGGYLQSVLSGYGGIRYLTDRLELHPRLFPGAAGLLITGLDYRGASIDINITTMEIVLTLTENWKPDTRLFVETTDFPVYFPLRLHEPITLVSQKIYIVPY